MIRLAQQVENEVIDGDKHGESAQILVEGSARSKKCVKECRERLLFRGVEVSASRQIQVS